MQVSEFSLQYSLRNSKNPLSELSEKRNSNTSISFVKDLYYEDCTFKGLENFAETNLPVVR